MRVVLQESLFGPHHVNLENEYTNGRETKGYPDLEKELKHFRGNLSLDNLVDFIVFDEENKVLVGDKVVIKRSDLNFSVYDNEQYIARVENLEETAVAKKIKAEAFDPPQHGITFIGTSDGFDPAGRTTGFIIWVNGRGILVDPPRDTSSWLAENGIGLSLITDIILTHVHSDHDSGTLQMLLKRGKIKLHTTGTILDSFVRKEIGRAHV